LAESPGNADVLLGRGRVYAWLGCWPEAEADLRAVTDAAPRYADAWSALGDLYLWSDRPLQAADAYGHWLALAAADDPAPLIARGRALRSSGDLVAARADFEAAGTRGADPASVRDLIESATPKPPAERAAESRVLGPAGFPWSASLSVANDSFASAGLSFTDTVATVRRYFERGSLGVEALAANRFGAHDQAFALDGYADLWSRSYLNLRFQDGPDGKLFPRTRWRAEVFQGVGRGWELATSYDRLGYTTATELFGFGVGRYLGNWYLRLRHLYIPATPGSGSSNSDRLVARYYYGGTADNYVEVAAGLGRNDQPTSFVTGPLPASHGWSGSAAFVKYLTPRIGFKLGVDLGYGLEGEPYSNRGIFATLYTRWK
ncbi:MAG: YaiO family outer membrane beta-barrel protein, partial [Deltaproteobacteria bacterium]